MGQEEIPVTPDMYPSEESATKAREEFLQVLKDNGFKKAPRMVWIRPLEYPSPPYSIGTKELQIGIDEHKIISVMEENGHIMSMEIDDIPVALEDWSEEKIKKLNTRLWSVAMAWREYNSHDKRDLTKKEIEEDSIRHKRESERLKVAKLLEDLGA